MIDLVENEWYVFGDESFMDQTILQLSEGRSYISAKRENSEFKIHRIYIYFLIALQRGITAGYFNGIHIRY